MQYQQQFYKKSSYEEVVFCGGTVEVAGKL